MAMANVCINCKNYKYSVVFKKNRCYAVYIENTIPITLKCNGESQNIINPEQHTCKGFTIKNCNE